MRVAILGLLFVFSAGAAGVAAENSYNDGIRSLSAKDWDKALGLLENALAADPDNLRYGSEYRQAVLQRARTLHAREGKPDDFDRCLKFFEQLTVANPGAANAYLNHGFAFVDKIPAAGAITQVILANTALGHFTKSLELRPSWIGYYTRGMSYLFWPKIFGRAKMGVADLQAALDIQKSGAKKPYHVRAWVALGDGYWKVDELEKARATWAAGLKEFPDCKALQERLSKDGDDLKALLDDALDPSKRVDTNLKELWADL